MVQSAICMAHFVSLPRIRTLAILLLRLVKVREQKRASVATQHVFA